MFKWLFGSKKSSNKSLEVKSELDPILSCAKLIIDNGELVYDNALARIVPSAMFEDNKGNTLRIYWHSGTGSINSVMINDINTPTGYDKKILRMAEKRIPELQKVYTRYFQRRALINNSRRVK